MVFLKRQAIGGVIDKELKLHWDSFRHKRLLNVDYSKDCIINSNNFKDIQLSMIPNVILLSAEKLVGFFMSTSYVSAYLRTLVEPRVYLHELEYSINELTSSSIFPVDFHIELILALKH